jgi:hypothetical protein
MSSTAPSTDASRVTPPMPVPHDADHPNLRRGPPRRGYRRVGVLDLPDAIYVGVAAEAAERGLDPIDLVEQLCADLALRRRLGDAGG